MNDTSPGEWLAPKSLRDSADERTLVNQIEEGLRTEHPYPTLRATVSCWFDDGLDEGEVLGVFLRFRDQLREQGRDRDEENIDNIIDCLVGWSGAFAVVRRESSIR